MKFVVLIIAMGVLGFGVFYYLSEKSSDEKRIAYERQQIKQAKEKEEARAFEEKKRKEDAAIAKEQKEAREKEDATRLFLRYIDREEARLKEIVEESKIELERIDLDQNSLSEELIAIDKANAIRATNARKHKEKNRDKLEKVLAMMNSPVLNRLARNYCGEDLSSLRSKYQSEIQRVKDVDDKYQKRMLDNVRRYNEQVMGVDDEVDAKNNLAKEKLKSAHSSVDARLPRMRAKVAALQKEIAAIERKPSKSQWDNKKLASLRSDLLLATEQLSRQEEVSALATANEAHLEATLSETRARRKYDAAGKTLTLEGDAALMERDHEQDVHNLAARFESASLDRIRHAMDSARQVFTVRGADAQKQIDYLRKAADNLDFLSATEIADLRRDVSKKITMGMKSVK